MFKALALAVVLSGVALSFVGSASAAPTRGDVWQQNYMRDRHSPSDTNGG